MQVRRSAQGRHAPSSACCYSSARFLIFAVAEVTIKARSSSGFLPFYEMSVRQVTALHSSSPKPGLSWYWKAVRTPGAPGESEPHIHSGPNLPAPPYMNMSACGMVGLLLSNFPHSLEGHQLGRKYFFSKNKNSLSI